MSVYYIFLSFPIAFFQSFKSVVEIIYDAFFKHSDKNALRSCAKAMTFCSTEGQADLQDFAQNKIKELEDELTVKLNSAMKEVEVCNMSIFLQSLQHEYTWLMF